MTGSGPLNKQGSEAEDRAEAVSFSKASTFSVFYLKLFSTLTMVCSICLFFLPFLKQCFSSFLNTLNQNPSRHFLCVNPILTTDKHINRKLVDYWGIKSYFCSTLRPTLRVMQILSLSLSLALSLFKTAFRYFFFLFCLSQIERRKIKEKQPTKRTKLPFLVTNVPKRDVVRSAPG